MGVRNEFDHVGFMSDPEQWPNLALPMKKYTGMGWPLLGMLIGDGPKVYIGNMFDERFIAQVRNNTAHVEVYESFQAAFDDGWRVD